MGKPILIYQDGQRYEIDSDQIYVPEFILDIYSNSNKGRIIPGFAHQVVDIVSENNEDKEKWANEVISPK